MLAMRTATKVVPCLPASASVLAGPSDHDITNDYSLGMCGEEVS